MTSLHLPALVGVMFALLAPAIAYSMNDYFYLTKENINLLNGRNYYAFGSGCTCRANAPGFPQIKTWKDHIEIFDGAVYARGNLCNDNVTTIEVSENQLKVSNDLNLLILDELKYEYRKNTPALCDSGTWCPVDSTRQPRQEK